MDLTISRVNFKNYSNSVPSKKGSETVANKSYQEINLNNDPRNIHFTGFFSALFGSPKKEEEPPIKPGIYGPYNLNDDQIKANDSMVFAAVDSLVACMTNRPSEDEHLDFPFRAKRADKKTVNKFVPICLTDFAYYQSSRTSFPEFYDTIVRAFPKACAIIDRQYASDNAARLYEGFMEKIMEFGRLADPEGRDVLKAGVAYLYFTNELPVYDMAEDELSTEETILNIKKKARAPKLVKQSGYPRCHMSRYRSEIDKYGTDYIKQRFGHRQDDPTEDGAAYTNIWGRKKNKNYIVKEVKKPDPPAPKEELCTLEEYVYDIMRGTL